MDKTHGQHNAYDQSISGGILSGSNLNSENWRPVVNTSIYLKSDRQSAPHSHHPMTVLHTQAAAAATTKEGEIRNDGNETKMTKKYKGKEKQGGRKRNKRWLLWLLFTAENLSHLMCTFSVYHQTIQKQEEIVPDKLWGSQPNNQLIRR